MKESTILERKTRWATQEGERKAQLQYLTGLLPEQDVCLLLEVSEHTLQKWRDLGIGPNYIKLGRSVFYHIDHLEAWIKINAVMTKGRGDEQAARSENGGPEAGSAD